MKGMNRAIFTGHAAAGRSPRQPRTQRARRALVALEIGTGAAALAGGALLAAAPDGRLLRADPGVLEDTPFTDWRLPGLLLAALVGGGYLFAGWWQSAGRPHARELSVAAGTGLIAFEAAELSWIGFQPLEAVCAGIGIAVITVARKTAPPSHEPGRTIRISGRIRIAVPAERVFDTVADTRNEPSFNPAMTGAELLTPPPIGLGTRFRARIGKAGTEMLVELTEFDRPHRLGSRTASSMMDTSGALTFTPEDQGTVMSWDWRVHLKGWLRMLGPLSGALGGRMERRIWAGLKRQLEGGTSPRRALPPQRTGRRAVRAARES